MAFVVFNIIQMWGFRFFWVCYWAHSNIAGMNPCIFGTVNDSLKCIFVNSSFINLPSEDFISAFYPCRNFLSKNVLQCSIVVSEAQP